MTKENNKNQTLAEKLNMLRAGVLGANDGIISVAGIVVGVASASDHVFTIMIAGLAGLMSGALSMAGGEYVSVSTQRDTEMATVETEKLRIKQHALEEEAGIKVNYLKKGLREETAKQVAKELMGQDALESILLEKYGIALGSYTNPWHAAFSSLFSFIVGAVIPLFSILLFPHDFKIMATFLVVCVALGITGFVSAYLGKAPKRPAVIRNIAVGMLTMMVTFVIGRVFHV